MVRFKMRNKSNKYYNNTNLFLMNLLAKMLADFTWYYYLN